MKVNYSTTKNCEFIGNKLYTTPEMTLTAEIMLKNIEHLELHYITENEREIYRFLKVYKKKEIPFERTGNSLYNYDGVFICQHCNRPLMKLYIDNILNYAIFVKCQCGIIYDNKRVRKIDDKESVAN